jgi:glucokinase
MVVNEAIVEMPQARSSASREAGRGFPVLLADIGGTNARFSMLAAPGALPEHFDDVRTADFPGVIEAVRHAVFARTPARPASAIIAVAAPVKGEVIPLTNCGWIITPAELIAALEIGNILILNDFEAQALASACAVASDFELIGRPNEISDETRLVIGPGTGLGVAGLVRAEGKWIPVPGEGGHVDLGPRSDRDRAIFAHLQPIEGRISAEQVLCGRGLVNLYTALCTADGVVPRFLTPEQITHAAFSIADPQAMETVRLFGVYLGRVAGDLALVYLAKGGVFLAGGISQKLLAVLKTSGFQSAFEDKAPHSDMMRAIPIAVLTHPRAAIIGLANYASRPFGFGLREQGRRWRR